MTDKSQPDPASPCISVCALNEDDVCIGCYRSADEIADWLLADADGKRAILARCAERRDAANQVRLL